jgi:DNA-binding transcriptional LysR family regulator
MDRIDAFRLFVRVVETGSFSRAARDLSVTQPTVTRQIAALERHFGVRLLNRNTRRLSVTDLGQAYYERGKTLLDLFPCRVRRSMRFTPPPSWCRGKSTR